MARTFIAGRKVGDLEDAILRQLWSQVAPVTGRELLDQLSGPRRAYTTVMTVLSRLVDKELVQRIPDGRTVRYQAAGDAAQLTAQAIGRLVATAHDPGAVLAHFVEGLDDPALVAELREVLDRGNRP